MYKRPFDEPAAGIAVRICGAYLDGVDASDRPIKVGDAL